MIIFSDIGQAVANLRAQKTRALLTALGVVFGVGSVIGMLAIGSGARSGDERSIASSSGMSKSASTVKHRISGSRSPAFASSTIFVTTTSVSGSSRSHESCRTSQTR